jgi:hypothetical protein
MPVSIVKVTHWLNYSMVHLKVVTFARPSCLKMLVKLRLVYILLCGVKQQGSYNWRLHCGSCIPTQTHLSWSPNHKSSNRSGWQPKCQSRQTSHELQCTRQTALRRLHIVSQIVLH